MCKIFELISFIELTLKQCCSSFRQWDSCHSHCSDVQDI